MAQSKTYEIVKALCEERNISIKQLEAALELGNGTIGAWDKSTPNVRSLIKVADYFHVSLDYLTGRITEGGTGA